MSLEQAVHDWKLDGCTRWLVLGQGEKSAELCVSLLGKAELLVGLQKGRGDVPCTLHSWRATSCSKRRGRAVEEQCPCTVGSSPEWMKCHQISH